MNLRLIRLTAAGPGRCAAELRNSRTGEVVVAEFWVDDRDGIRTASAVPDVFRDFDGTADEQRQIVAAVVAFSAVASADVDGT